MSFMVLAFAAHPHGYTGKGATPTQFTYPNVLRPGQPVPVEPAEQDALRHHLPQARRLATQVVLEEDGVEQMQGSLEFFDLRRANRIELGLKQVHDCEREVGGKR